MEKHHTNQQDDEARAKSCIRCGKIATTLRNWEDFKASENALVAGKWSDHLNSKDCRECQKVVNLFRQVGDESLFSKEATIYMSGQSNQLEVYMVSPNI
jgi:hypothetical protein